MNRRRHGGAQRLKNIPEQVDTSKGNQTPIQHIVVRQKINKETELEIEMRQEEHMREQRRG